MKKKSLNPKHKKQNKMKNYLNKKEAKTMSAEIKN
jgi:hypothetical protein